MENPGNSSCFFQNRDCEYFPCHKGITEKEFSCLFCYCPLYSLGKQCGGNYTYTAKGVKSCQFCTFPHQKENYPKILARFDKIKAVVRKMDGEQL